MLQLMTHVKTIKNKNRLCQYDACLSWACGVTKKNAMSSGHIKIWIL
jgi:hypothetical protein